MKKLVLIISLILFASNTNAQDSTFHKKTFTNTIKVYPFLFARNIGTVFYERQYSERSSFEIGLGYCYGFDYVNMYLGDIVASASDILNSYYNQEHYTERFKRKRNFFVSISLKQYLSTKKNYGYFEENIRFYNYTYDFGYLGIYGKYQSPEDQTLEVQNINFNFIYGFSIPPKKGRKLINDFQFGLGFGSLFCNTLKSNGNKSPSITVYYQDGPHFYLYPNFLFRYSVGIGW